MKHAAFFLSAILLFTSPLASAHGNWPKRADDLDGIQERNIITSIINSVLSHALPTLTDVQIGNLSFEGNSLAEINIHGLNDTEVVALEPEGSISVKNLALTVNEINITGYYNFESLSLCGLTNLNGNGGFSVDLGLNFSTGIAITTSNSTTPVELEVVDLPNFYLQLDNFTVNFENIMGGGAQGHIINLILSDCVPNLVANGQGQWMEEHGPALMEVLANFLNCAKSHLINIDVCFSQNLM